MKNGAALLMTEAAKGTSHGISMRSYNTAM
jgi:hypothetical protein